MLWLILLCLSIGIQGFSQATPRKDIVLSTGWQSIADDQNQNAYAGFEQPGYDTKNWKNVTVPHNWNQYEGYRRLKHGDRHGYAWYRTSFTVKTISVDKAYFLYFEGVGSYATVWLNGKQVGYHAGGRTTFTIEIGKYLQKGKPNMLAVRADHPDNIQDLPWVCGGSSDEVGFSEGSQPMGIFRPVHFMITDPVRIQPFGVHIWNDTTVSEKSARLDLETEIRNYSTQPKKVNVVNRLIDENGIVVAEASSENDVPANETIICKQNISFPHAHLWSLANPYLYKVVTKLIEGPKLTDQETTPYGIRWISWPIGRSGTNKQFMLNGKPVFINGIAEYEHLMGQSHAFTNQEIHTRVMQVKATGFNAFRDAHQPHNLEYQKYWDELGILWWPQFTAHIWYDTPQFRENFKTLLTDWVKERRNSPSNILWGLQNESKLPEAFAKECSDIIRKLDPTASSQRKITTCNGGKGTDWDVPQNWTGTYGGDPQTYAQDLQKQVLVGEYGAWRSIDMHTDGPFVQSGQLSENRMEQLTETKIRLAETVKGSSAGHFMWLLSSHENPGRTQAGEGYRELDRIGPVNYKGLLTPWAEPTDAYYLYRANFAPKDKEPMVYIVSHTWPDRWFKPGNKDSISVYSNCDEVELFNDVKGLSLGRKKQPGRGSHFQWDGVDIQYNVLYAIGYVKGHKVAEDVIVLNHLPQSPSFNRLYAGGNTLLKPTPGLNYLYRVNCGGPDYTDRLGNQWMGDVHQNGEQTWGSTSWTDSFPGMLAMFGSQRRTFDPVKGTADWPLFQTFRYGTDQLNYHFPVADGDYQVELYFTEPWYGDNVSADCSGWRVFDVAVNGKTLVKYLDIWKEAGYNAALKKTIKVHVEGGKLNINFPHIESGEAVISAIAIASSNQQNKPAMRSATTIAELKAADPAQAKLFAANLWMDTGDQPYTDQQTAISKLPVNLYGAEWLKMPSSNSENLAASFRVTADADVYIAVDGKIKQKPEWMQTYGDTKTTLQTDAGGGHLFEVYTKHFTAGTTVNLGNKDIDKGHEALMYIVAVLPSTPNMEPATDLKPTVSYKAELAVMKGDSLVKEDVGGRKCIVFKGPGQIEWSISTGVGDSHELRIKYVNTAGNKASAKVKLLAEDGTVMKEANLTFGTTQPDKWKTVGFATGNSINAGNYKVVLTSTDALGLSVSGLEVQ